MLVLNSKTLTIQASSNTLQTYVMYLDDGISRDSAPVTGPGLKIGDEKADNKYCQVEIQQVIPDCLQSKLLRKTLILLQ